jgi:3-oxoadipate enol-lactonase
MMGQIFAWLWQTPHFAPAMTAANKRMIEWESLCWQLVSGRRPDGPVVHWHEGGEGPPLILVNGFTASGLAWPLAWIRTLETRYRVIRVDNRGTGWSREAPAPFTLSDMADDVRDILDALEIENATVLGMSMGGMIAQELAIRHPNRVRRLVLAATIPPIPAAVLAPTGVMLGSRLFKAAPAGDMPPNPWDAMAEARLWLEFAGEKFTPPEGLLEEISHEALARVTPMVGTFMQARAIGSWSGPAALARIMAPTIVVQGEADKIVPIENAQRLSELIPDAQLVTIPDAGHLLPWEAGEALIDAIGGV